MMLDQGGGGLTLRLHSYFKLAVPAKIDYLTATDVFSLAPIGTNVNLQAKVTDLLGAPVAGARVRWGVISSPASGASLGAASSLTDANGIAQVALTVSSRPGHNVVHASGKGLADSRATGCTADGAPSSCNGPRAAAPYGPFDPFVPLNLALEGTTGTAAVTLADGTRVPYTVAGCPGFGTPAAIDGVLAAGEWACANSAQFPVAVGTGSVTATVYWMNDGSTFHLAVSVPATDTENGLRIEWDNNGSSVNATGARAAGDDVWGVSSTGTALDRYVDARCARGTQVDCGTDDGTGKMQTVVGFKNTGGVTVYEVSHPLQTGDVATGFGIDIPGAVDAQLGMFLSLRLGNGSPGLTHWPGFMVYRGVTIW
jgi:hypothetical protein